MKHTFTVLLKKQLHKLFIREFIFFQTGELPMRRIQTDHPLLLNMPTNNMPLFQRIKYGIHIPLNSSGPDPFSPGFTAHKAQIVQAIKQNHYKNEKRNNQ